MERNHLSGEDEPDDPFDVLCQRGYVDVAGNLSDTTIDRIKRTTRRGRLDSFGWLKDPRQPRTAPYMFKQRNTHPVPVGGAVILYDVANQSFFAREDERLERTLTQLQAVLCHPQEAMGSIALEGAGLLRHFLEPSLLAARALADMDHMLHVAVTHGRGTLFFDGTHAQLDFTDIDRYLIGLDIPLVETTSRSGHGGKRSEPMILASILTDERYHVSWQSARQVLEAHGNLRIEHNDNNQRAHYAQWLSLIRHMATQAPHAQQVLRDIERTHGE